jgi:hypothetical protein
VKGALLEGPSIDLHKASADWRLDFIALKGIHRFGVHCDEYLSHGLRGACTMTPDPSFGPKTPRARMTFMLYGYVKHPSSANLSQKLAAVPISAQLSLLNFFLCSFESPIGVGAYCCKNSVAGLGATQKVIWP